MIRLLTPRRRAVAPSRPRLAVLKAPASRLNHPAVTAAAARATSVAVESLELRRMLSGAYNQTAVIAPPAPGFRANFGSAVATHNNLALISAPNKAVGSLSAVGQAYLIDTGTGQVLRTFDDPQPNANDRFGSSVAFVGDKIAIGATENFSGGLGKVYVYDNATATNYTELDAPTANLSFVTDFGNSITSDGSSLFVGMANTSLAGGGQVMQYDGQTFALTRSYADPTAAHAGELGGQIAVSGDTVYATGNNSGLGRIVIAFNKSDGSYLRTYSEPTPGTPTEINTFGLSLATGSSGDLFVGDSEAMYQFDGSGSYVRQYISPDINTLGVQGFGASLSTNSLNQVVVGATLTVAFDDPSNPTLEQEVGAVYVFDAATGSLVDSIGKPSPSLSQVDTNGFGTATAALPNGKILITDALDDTLSQDAGLAYVYAPAAAVSQPPVADAGADVTATNGMPVTFTGSGSSPTGNAIVEYEWDFNYNGTSFVADPTATTAQVTHTFTAQGTYTVALRVTDDNGNTGIDTLVVTVPNSAPIPAINGTLTTTENGTVSLSAAGSTDIDGDALSYSWDLNNDGVYGDATGATASLSRDLPGNYPVSVRVSDTAGNTSTASTSVNFTDVAPTANAGGNQTVSAGGSLSFSGSGANAAGDAIVSYEWDFNYGGNPANFNVAVSGANVTRAFPTAGTYTVALRVTDDDGQSAISTAVVTVSVPPPPPNTAPTGVAIAGQSDAVRLQTIGFTGTYTDPDANDAHTFAWNFGDGTTVSGATATVSHAFAATGVYTVTLTVTDSHGASGSVNFAVNVTASGVQGGVIYVGGTGGSDALSVSKNGSGGYDVTVGGTTATYASSIVAAAAATTTSNAGGSGGRIVIFGGAGNDDIEIGGSVDALVEVHGGAGNDTIKGGNGGNIILGDDGDDSLTGGSARDFIVGGRGADSLTGSPDDDVVVAGTTSYDNDSAALGSIYTTWNSALDYTTRVSQLQSGALAPAAHVFDDAAVDTLIGCSGQDYFIFNVDVTIADIVVDLKPAEVATIL